MMKRMKRLFFCEEYRTERHLLFIILIIFLFLFSFSIKYENKLIQLRSSSRSLNEVPESGIKTPHHHEHHRPNLHQFIGITQLKDRILCNNIEEDTHIHDNYKCYAENNNEIPCAEKKLDDSNCQMIHLRLYNHDTISLTEKMINILLEEFFIKVDTNENFRRMQIEFTADAAEHVERLIDEILTPRLWLFISSETYLNQANKDSASKQVYHITIDRYFQNYENQLKLISSIQYPDQKTCERAPILLSRKNPKDPGWGSVLHMYYMAQENHPFAILSIYVSESNRFNESTCFISSEDCPHEKNKWLCAFLSSTNCSLPSFIKDCSEDRCLEQYPETNYFSSLFSNFSEQSTFIASKESSEFLEISQIAHQPLNSLQEEYHRKYSRFDPFLYLQPYSLIQQKIPLPLMTMSSQQCLYQQFYLRMNSFYRKKVNEYIEEFYSKYSELAATYPSPKKTKFRCIAAHIRRGDRIIYGTNMSSFCKKYSRYEDYGCASPIPFGEVNLASIVNKANLLVNHHNMTTGEMMDDDNNDDNTYNIFIASDDPIWLEEQKKLYDESFSSITAEDKTSSNSNNIRKKKKKWNIYPIFPSKSFQLPILSTFPSDTEYRDYLSEFRYKKGTISGVYFMATLKLFQQCDGFIGHFGSGVSWLIYRTLCTRNNFGMGYCPPVYDLRRGL